VTGATGPSARPLVLPPPGQRPVREPAKTVQLAAARVATVAPISQRPWSLEKFRPSISTWSRPFGGQSIGFSAISQTAWHNRLACAKEQARTLALRAKTAG